MKEDKEITKEKIPIATQLWSDIYEELIKNGVIFPKGYKGIIPCYGCLCIIDRTLKSQRQDIIKIIKGVKTQVGTNDPKAKESANFIIDSFKSHLVNLIERKDEQD